MSSKAHEHGTYTEYTFFDMVDGSDTYEQGDDDYCPACGEGLRGEYRDTQFTDGVSQVVYTCPKCGKDLTFNYYLQNVIAE